MDDDDVNTFTRRFQGFLAGININIAVKADRVRALGILRSCLTNDAAKMVPHQAFEEDWTNTAIFYLKNQYPTVLEERHKVQFGNLDQGNDPVKTFYEKVKKYSNLLNFSDEVINHQFFRGLSPDNQVEVERIGSEKARVEK
ncbi:13553_t:CDS:2 [Entrophospora sp. SA101]|nr:13553_t:CDS:2 [Entrophospora sp. SA101]